MTVTVEVIPSEDYVVFGRYKSVPVDQLVGAGLQKAEQAGIPAVTVPLMPAENASEDPTLAVLRAVLIFKSLGPQNVKSIRILVYRNPAAVRFLKEELERALESEKQNYPGYVRQD